jgi:hypothetical protein
MPAESSTLVARQKPVEAARIDEEMRRLHPIGRGASRGGGGRHCALLSEDASFINGAIVPVDGGRSALGRDPEEA